MDHDVGRQRDMDKGIEEHGDVMMWRLTAIPYYQPLNMVTSGLRLMPYGNGFPEPYVPLPYTIDRRVIDPCRPSA